MAPPAPPAPATETPPAFDPAVPHSARVWNCWLGGKDHFRADRDLADLLAGVDPGAVAGARACRAFLARAVRHLAGEEGVRQFLDVGCGLPDPSGGNTHDVAQRSAPDARVVYVDNDPLVLVHARALLVGTDEGVTACVEADVRDPERILAAAAETLDLTLPVALVLTGVMGHVEDLGEARAIVERLTAALPPGGCLVLADRVGDPPADVEASDGHPGHGYRPRRRREVAAFFDGLHPLEPGVVPVTRWRPDPGDDPGDDAGYVGGVARRL